MHIFLSCLLSGLSFPPLSPSVMASLRPALPRRDILFPAVAERNLETDRSSSVGGIFSFLFFSFFNQAAFCLQGFTMFRSPSPRHHGIIAIPVRP
ncbi:hypothetical protein B0I35DRAFT_229414 [Stachybotrys elegans]|uniref:Uncharacterized protein n=1 Tax=Stachybotrys elegans TaxID=80388 RepID=A0A8K0STH2_9HYPO|nr:hypothetical protein B0I35DRAFT_229414 [Stachybotrys elegans]